MKVHRLWIGEHRVLRDLTLRFSPVLQGREGGLPSDHGYSLDLLVGVNGTGKSTVLRAIADVFRQIQHGTRDDDFGFSITYQRSADELITVENVDDRGQRLPAGFRVKKGEDEFTQEPSAQQFSPARYVTYTTGNDEAWQRSPEPQADDPDRERWDRITGGPYWQRERPGLQVGSTAGEAELSPNHVHVCSDDLPLVTLCGLLEHAARRPAGSSPGGLAEALEELGVQRLCAFSLRFHLEPEAGTRDDRKYIAALQGLADYVRVQGTSRLLVFDCRTGIVDLLNRMLQALERENTLALFQELSRLSRAQGDYAPLLRRTEMFLERMPAGQGSSAPDLHTYDWFSDGERTFLARMCMLSLFGAGNALLLLDEPEVHFNDYWKRKLLRLLDQSLHGHQSHVILTTHSSVVLTDARRGQIVVLDRDQEGFTSRPRSIDIRTFAADPSDVMVTVFGAEQATGAKSSEDIQRLLLDYAASGAASSPRRRRLRKKLEAISRELGPGYWRYRVADVLENG